MQQCKTVLLADDPSENDALGGHTPLAEAMAQTVMAESGGKAIALIGTYGSGKSTVIRLFERDLRNADSETAVFLFDAWAHQGDPLRRSFLEELSSFLLRNKWIAESSSALNAVGSLGAREDTSKSKTTSIITIEGVAVLASIPFSAGAVALIDHYPIAFFLVPLPVYVGAALWWLAFRRNDERTQDWRLLSELFLNKPVEFTATTTTRQVEPTSVEFRRLFEALLSEARVTTSANRRLVIVLDNLDRLPTEEAMTLFATMRTFFDPNSPHTVKEEKLSEQLWLIVPFDTNWLKQLSDSGMAGSDGSGSMIQTPGTNFLEKSFQVQFVVAEPVVGKWKEYFIGLLRLAFPTHDEDDFEKVYFLYNQAGAKAAARTPRAMKQYINRLGSLHREWQDEINFRVQAAYALFVRPGSPLIPSLVSGDAAKIIFGLSADTILAVVACDQWQLQLAALYFGVSPDQANHMLLAESIGSALSNKDIATLDTLMSIEGAEPVCESVVGERTAIWPSKEFGAACTALRVIGLLHKPVIENRLRLAAGQLKDWNGDREDQSSVIDLFKGLSRDQLRMPLRRMLAALSPPVEVTDESGVGVIRRQLDRWILNASELILWIESVLGETETAEALSVPSNPVSFLSLGEAVVAKSDGRLFRLLRPKSRQAKEAILTHILTQLRAGGDSSRNALPVLKAMAGLQSDWDVSSIAVQMMKDLSTDADFDAARTSCTIELVAFMAYHAKLDLSADLTRLCTSGLWLRHMATILNDPRGFGIGAFVFLMNHGTENFVGNAQAAWERLQLLRSHPERGDVDGIANVLTEAAINFGELNTLLETLFEGNRGTLAGSVILRAMNRSALASALATTLVIDRFKEVRNCVDDATFEKLLHNAISEGSLDEELVAKGFAVELSPLYIDRLQRKAPSHELVQLLEVAVQSQEKSVWEGELKRPGEWTALLGALTQLRKAPWLSTPLSEAFDDLCFELKGQTTAMTPEILTGARTLLAAVLPEYLELPLSRLCKSLENAWIPGAIDLFGDALLESDALRRDAHDFIVNAAANILRVGDATSVQWLSRLLKDQDYAEAITKDVRQDLAEKALARDKDTNNATLHQALGEIVKLLESLDPSVTLDVGTS